VHSVVYFYYTYYLICDLATDVSHVLNSVAPRLRMSGPVTLPHLSLHGVDKEIFT
jgi:hypothetical protein